MNDLNRTHRVDPLGRIIQDLYGDTADLHPRTDYNTGDTDGVHLTVDFDDPDGNRLDFDLDGAKKLRDALNQIIDAQSPRTPTQVVNDLAIEEKQKEAPHGHE